MINSLASVRCDRVAQDVWVRRLSRLTMSTQPWSAWRRMMCTTASPLTCWARCCRRLHSQLCWRGPFIRYTHLHYDMLGLLLLQPVRQERYSRYAFGQEAVRGRFFCGMGTLLPCASTRRLRPFCMAWVARGSVCMGRPSVALVLQECARARFSRQQGLCRMPRA